MPDTTPRPLRSFVLRAGRTTSGQSRALQELGPRFLVPYGQGLETLAGLYPQLAAQAQMQNAAAQRPLVLEIGFGIGQATADVAAAQPDTDFIGVEVHVPGVGALLKLIGEQDLHNLRIVQHDAVEVLTHMLAPGCLAGVHIWFPDPWHKKRHNKRRLLQPGFVELLVSRLAPGGYIHCATDWAPYAEQMLEVLSGCPALVNSVGTGYAPRPAWRPLTKFENRGLNLGHGVWDLVFRLSTPPGPCTP